MVLLNGEVSGHFGQATVLDSIEELNEATQTYIKRKYELKNVIKDLVYTLGGEKLDNIFINDLDELGLKMLKYIGQSDLFIMQSVDQNTWLPNENSYNLFTNGLDILKANEEWTVGEVPNADDFIQLPKDINSFGFSMFNNDIKNEKTILFKGIIKKDEDAQYFLLYRLKYGDIAGYEATPMVFNSDLIAQPGETITSALDKIVAMLGSSYEYFYDIYGRFIFQKKKTYLDTSWSPLSFYLDGDSFTLKQDPQEFVFEFLDEQLINSININPGIDKVKNDFIVYGQTAKGYPIHLRYSIDKKPTRYISWDWSSYYSSNEEIGNNTGRPDPNSPIEGTYVNWEVGNEGLVPTSNQKIYKTKTQTYFSMANWNFDRVNNVIEQTSGQPLLKVGRYLKIGNSVHQIIGIENTTLNTRKRIQLDDPMGLLQTGRYQILYFTLGNNQDKFSEVQAEHYVDWRELIYQMAKDFHAHGQDSDYIYQMRLRNPVLFQKGKSGYEQYYTDIMGFWPDVYRYNIKAPTASGQEITKEIVGWNQEKLSDPNTMMYWLEFLEGNSQFDAISVPNIGDRTKVASNKKSTVLFEPNVPPLLYYIGDQRPATTLQYTPIQLNDDLKTAFSLASFPTAAKTVIEDELNNYSTFTRSVSLNTVPLYSLDVNRKVRIKSEKIQGQFIIDRLTIPLQYNGMMSVTLSEITDSLY